MLPASARDPRRRAPAHHEAERGTRLVGPSLLPTYEFGEADGAVFMAMPLVVGCTLAEIVSQRRASREGTRPGPRTGWPSPTTGRTPARSSRVARPSGPGGGRAHAGRVVHRDIKPGNILVRRDHAEGAFLCDFGLAPSSTWPRPGQLRDGAGSPLYMAPERLLKRQADEVRGDVYALGITLSEALTLAPPVEVPNDLPRTCWASFLAAASPRRPSASGRRSPTPGIGDLPRHLAQPDRRHPTADHFADDLERVLIDSGGRARGTLTKGR